MSTPVRARISGLRPRFDPRVRDYVSACEGGGLTVRLRAMRGAEVRLGGGSWGQRVRERVRLSPGESTSFAVRRDDARRHYHVRCLPAGFPRWRYDARSPGAAPFYAVTPGDWAVIFDRNGAPVWWWRESRGAHGLQVLGNGNLAFSRSGGAGFGVNAKRMGHEIRTPSGRLVRLLRTRGAPTDHHELQELSNGNYLLDTYAPRDRPVDFSAWGGPTDAPVVDGELQELDRRGRVVWRWSSADHVATSERLRRDFSNDSPLHRRAEGRGAYDMAHLNSADVVGDRVVISLRFMDAVYAVDRAGGEVIWKLGGTEIAESLRVIDDRERPPLAAQHDARVRPDGTVTVFDNRTGGHGRPRAVRYQIDEAAGTATFIEERVDPRVSISKCCGSARVLGDGSWLVGWGGPDVTEFTPDGDIAFRLRFPGTFTYRAIPAPRSAVSIEELRSAMDRIAARRSTG